MALSYLALGIFMHVGGIPTQALFQSPQGVGNVADESFTVTWADNEQDPTGQLYFYFQPTNVPPNAVVGDLGGDEVLPDGGPVAVMDTQNQLTWSTAGVPAGSYFVYAVTHDPPLPQVFGVSRGVVTVQHPGEPLYPAVIITDPGSVAPPVADAFAVRWQASGVGPLTATVKGRPRGDAGGFQIIAADLPMQDAGGGRATGCYVWNMTSLAQGYYEVQVEVKDAAGRTHASYSVSNITIYRDPNPTDAAPAPSCDAPPTTDAGGNPGDDTGGDDPGGPGCGCHAGARGPGAPGLGAALLLAAAVLARRGR